MITFIAGVWVYIFVVSTSLAAASFSLLDGVVGPLVDGFLSLGSLLMILFSMVYWSFVKSSVSGAMHEHRVVLSLAFRRLSFYFGKWALVVFTIHLHIFF